LLTSGVYNNAKSSLNKSLIYLINCNILEW